MSRGRRRHAFSHLTQSVHVLANRHQLAETSDRLTVDPKRHRDDGGVAEARRDRSELLLTELARNELPDVLLLVRMVAEVLEISLGGLIDGQGRRGFIDTRDGRGSGDLVGNRASPLHSVCKLPFFSFLSLFASFLARGVRMGIIVHSYPTCKG